MYAPSEIAKLYNVLNLRKNYIMKNNILRLNISVNNSQTMYVVYSIADLFHQKYHFGFLQRLRLFQIMVQLSSCTHFEDNVYVIVIIEITVHFDNIRVVEKHLNLEFSDELFSYLFFQNNFLFNHFKSAYEPSAFLPKYQHNYLAR